MSDDTLFAGAVYQKDGTCVYGRKEIRAQFDINNIPYAVKVQSDNDGHFAVAVEDLDIEKLVVTRSLTHAKKYFRWPANSKFWVGGTPVKSSFQTPAGRMVLVQAQDRFLGQRNLSGGFISGKIVDHRGNGQKDIKVEGQIVKKSGFSWLNSSQAKTWTGKKGQFVLEFRGGDAVGPLYIGGKPARSISRARKDADDLQIPAETTFQAGSFGLKIVQSPKILGLF